MTQSSPASPRDVAQLIFEGFDLYREKFRKISQGARIRFDRADWLAVQQASMDRIELY
ncbi:MAG: isocitrate dehydrogenase kinase/phosphatase AceK regulatory subunit, partial [Pseudomonadales bacterium]